MQRRQQYSTALPQHEGASPRAFPYMQAEAPETSQRTNSPDPAVNCTFAGISKEDIVQRPATEILARVKQNLKHNNQNVQALKISSLKRKIEENKEEK